MDRRYYTFIAVIGCLLLMQAAFAAPRYKVVDLGTLGGDESAAFRINNAGQILGSAGTAEGYFHSVLWSSGKMIDLTPLMETDPRNWTNSKLYSLGVIGLNEAGMTSGTQRMEDDTMRAFLWNDSGLLGLGDLGGDSIAFDLNDSEQVVGHVQTPDGAQSFIWEKGEVTQIGSPWPGSTVAMAVNSIGQVTGNTCVTRPHATIPGLFDTGTYAFIWENGTMKELGYLAGPSSSGMDINDVGQVVGISVAKNGPIHGTLWDDGEVIDLGVLYEIPDEGSIATAVNNHCQIVGVSTREWVPVDESSGVKQAVNCGFYWEDGELSNLNDLIDAPGKWDIQSPGDINDSGVIVGAGRYTVNGLVWVANRAFMLVPVDDDGQPIVQQAPAPSAFVVKPL